MSHSPARNSQLPLLLLIILAATACGKSPPKQAGDADSLAIVAAMEQGNSGKVASPAFRKDRVPVALAAAQDYCRGSICKDYKILPPSNSLMPPPSRPISVTDADRANGIEDKCCVVVSYLARSGAGPWKDELFDGIYTKRSGAWKKLQRFCI